MSTVTQSQVSHKVAIQATAADWQTYRNAKARANAAAKEVSAIESALGLPDAKSLARLVGFTAEGEAQTVLVTDGNGSPLGSLTVYWFSGSETPAGIRRRVNA